MGTIPVLRSKDAPQPWGGPDRAGDPPTYLFADMGGGDKPLDDNIGGGGGPGAKPPSFVHVPNTGLGGC